MRGGRNIRRKPKRPSAAVYGYDGIRSGVIIRTYYIIYIYTGRLMRVRAANLISYYIISFVSDAGNRDYVT